MIRYTKADDDTLALLRDVIAKHHPDLAQHGVRVAVTMCKDPDQLPAVTHGGYPVNAKISLVSKKKRVHTPADVEIEIDESVWNKLCDQSKAALLDHELEHVEFCQLQGDPPKPTLADDDRPKLRLKLDDWCLTGFRSIVERHGSFALEFAAVQELHATHKQLLFPKE